jgi:alpha-beta hydrolase superfamily lysophospholipase
MPCSVLTCGGMDILRVFAVTQHRSENSANRFPGLPQFLYGHSMGGNLVLYYAITRQPKINGLIVTGPALANGRPVPSWKITLGKVMYALLPAFQMDNGLDLDNLARDPQVVKAYREDPLVHGKISARLGMDLINNGTTILQNAARLTLPLLLMQGSRDHIVSPEATHRFADCGGSQVTFKLWDDFYHELHNEPEQAEVLETMVKWLDSH